MLEQGHCLGMVPASMRSSGQKGGLWGRGLLCRGCVSEAHTSSSLLMAPADFSVLNQLTSGRISLRVTFLLAQWGAGAISPAPVQEAAAGAGPTPQPRVPGTLWRVEGDGGTRRAEKLLLPEP